MNKEIREDLGAALQSLKDAEGFLHETSGEESHLLDQIFEMVHDSRLRLTNYLKYKKEPSFKTGGVR